MSFCLTSSGMVFFYDRFQDSRLNVQHFDAFLSHFRGAAKNKFYLKKIGVTHVLNTAEGSRVGSVVSVHSSFGDAGASPFVLTRIRVHIHQTYLTKFSSFFLRTKLKKVLRKFILAFTTTFYAFLKSS